MKTINLNKENCPYCDITLEITGDSDRSVFNWHLGGHGESLHDDEQISVLESEFNMNIKQKAREMFDERFIKESVMTNVKLIERQNPNEILNFIDQIIDLTILERDKEIVEMMWQVREDWRNDGQIQALPTADYLINLINNTKTDKQL